VAILTPTRCSGSVGSPRLRRDNACWIPVCARAAGAVTASQKGRNPGAGWIARTWVLAGARPQACLPTPSAPNLGARVLFLRGMGACMPVACGIRAASQHAFPASVTTMASQGCLALGSAHCRTGGRPSGDWSGRRP
jgi:hypothetical protein